MISIYEYFFFGGEREGEGEGELSNYIWILFVWKRERGREGERGTLSNVYIYMCVCLCNVHPWRAEKSLRIPKEPTLEKSKHADENYLTGKPPKQTGLCMREREKKRFSHCFHCPKWLWEGKDAQVKLGSTVIFSLFTLKDY